MTDRAFHVARGGDEECPGCSASHAKRDLDNQETCLCRMRPRVMQLRRVGGQHDGQAPRAPRAR